MADYFNLFDLQTFDHDTESRAIANNMAIDLHLGHQELIRESVLQHTDMAAIYTELSSLKAEELARVARRVRSQSILMTVVMLTGRCNADCGICYTDRHDKIDALTLTEVQEIIDQTYELGSRLVYIPGEGEPTLDPSFFDILKHCRRREVSAIVFTNGLVFSNDDESRRVWKMDGETAVARLRDYPVYFYHKLWTLRPQLLGEMMGLDPSMYTWDTISTSKGPYRVPLGLSRLIRILPRERVGIECVVERRNVQEIVEDIIPFIGATGVRSYIEPIIHAGRCFDIHQFDVSATDLERLRPWLARQLCRRIGYKCTIHNDGTVAAGMSIVWQRLYRDEDLSRFSIRHGGGVKDLFRLLHTIPELVQARYMGYGCLCEQLNLDLAKGIRAPFLRAVAPS